MPVPSDPGDYVNEVTEASADVLNNRFAPLYDALDPAAVGLDADNFAAGGLDDAALFADNTITAAKLVAAVRDALMPVGSIFAYGGSAAPTSSFVLCDGSAISRSTYASLFTALGSGAVYGAGNGTTTFNVPDLRGRVPVGVDGAGARLSANDALGNTGGEETHVLSSGELPSHLHSSYVVADLVWYNHAPSPTQPLPDYDYPIARMTGGSTGSTGSGTAHNTMQPFQIVNYLIRAL